MEMTESKIWTWASLGLEIVVAAAVALFLGICWNELRATKEAASNILKRFTTADEWQTVEGESLKANIGAEGIVVYTRSAEILGQLGLWSGNSDLFTQFGGIGRAVEIRFETLASGRHHLLAYPSLGPDHAIVDLYVDGKLARAGVDLRNEARLPGGPIDLGRHLLGVGPHTLRVVMMGPKAEESGRPNAAFGLDKILLRLEEAGALAP